MLRDNAPWQPKSAESQRHTVADSITWWAVASSDGGMVRSSALAVLRFIRSSNVRRLLNRQVAGVCALENLVHIRSRAPKEPIVARTLGEQTACISEFKKAVHSGKSVLAS